MDDWLHVCAATNISIAPITPIAPTTIRPPEISATFVSADLVIKPAQELVAPPSAASSPAPAPVPVSLPPSVSAPVDNSTAVLPSNPVVAPSDPRINYDRGKRSLISRLNPFGRKPRELDLKKAIPVKTNVMVTAATPVAVTPEPVPTAPPPPPMFTRYPYQSPVPPPSGNRTQADVAFSRGLKAHQAGNRKLAIDEYQAALRADPAYFDACYNLGLAAQDTGELGLALIAFETALALKPDSIDARYNFAIALKSGGYARDAFDQFEKILRSNPNEVRAHLSMANLCAQQLREPALARPHYETVLELKPGHAEATKIRLWLSNNP